MSDSVLFVLVVDKNYQEAIVDSLIEFPHATGFTLLDVNGFSQAHQHYDVGEQVQGFRDMIRIEVVVRQQDKPALFECLGGIPKRDPFHYWEYPVLSEGKIS